MAGHSAKNFLNKKINFFAECPVWRHSAKNFFKKNLEFLCRVPPGWALGKEIRDFFLKNSLPSVFFGDTRQSNR